MPYNVAAAPVGAIAIAVVRGRAAIADLSSVVPAAIGEVWTLIRARQFSGAGRNVAVYYGDTTSIVNIECGVEAPPGFEGDSDVLLSTTPSGLVAHTDHLGDYRRLGQAHAAIRSWCASNGHRLRGPNWEIYGHWSDDPAKVRTDVFYLLDQ